ncbi:MAG: AraC family transcriptional regulator ligand-binding domain-containing protein [Rhodobacteraceae bacterium]|nr:AraC family transcriptional regulator ligand-binding domain-containing protein [Paracoccaceae bacterium]
MLPDNPAVVPDFWFRSMLAHPGLSPDLTSAALEALRIDPEVLQAGQAAITQDDEANLIDHLARAVGNDLMGLEVGLAHQPRQGTILTYISRSSATLGDALHLMTRYIPITRPLAQVQLIHHDAGAVIRFANADPRITVHVQHVEFMIGAVVSSFRVLTGTPDLPALVRMAHLRRHGHNRISSMLNCAVEMESSTAHEMHFTADMLSLPLLTADDALLGHLTSYADLLLEQRRSGQPSLCQKVEAAVLRRIAHGVPTLQTIAADLATSDRTLSRRLAEDGLSYRQVVDDLRRMMAETYLAEADLPLAEIAFLLGFADQSAFGTAFRRWTGSTPGQARAAARARKNGA